jgi:hypothetical protein
MDRDFLLPLEGTAWWARGPIRLPGRDLGVAWEQLGSAGRSGQLVAVGGPPPPGHPGTPVAPAPRDRALLVGGTGHCRGGCPSSAQRSAAGSAWRPLEHPPGLVFVEEAAAHEEPQHRATKRLGQRNGVMARLPRPAHEGPVGPEPAVGDEEVEMGVPVGPGAVGLQAGDDADPEVGTPWPTGARVSTAIAAAPPMVRHSPASRRTERVKATRTASQWARYRSARGRARRGNPARRPG